MPHVPALFFREERSFMPTVFDRLDRIKPVYDFTEKLLMIICKLLLIADILIASYTVLGRYCTQLAHDHPDALGWLGFLKDPPWSEEVILSCMAYMAVLAAALAIRHNAHIRMTALDRYLPGMVIKVLDIVADLAVLALALVMLVVGWQYTSTLGSKGTYVSMPWLSRFWMYLPVPMAGLFMIVFEIEALYNHIKAFFVKDGEKEGER